MRSFKAEDYWKRAYKRPYPNSLVEIDFNNLNHLPSLQLPEGIAIICGLNGAGKSTVISAIKDLIGYPLSDHDKHRLSSQRITGKIKTEREDAICSNEEGKRLFDQGWNRENIIYIDCVASTSIQSFMVNQTNLEELLDQFEEYELSTNEIEEINYLIGKQYGSCTVKELTDMKEDAIFPYFHVNVDGIEYDSKSMGYGEHFLFYLFWCIKQANDNTLIIIEEPETFISIASQIHFSNYLGKQMATKGIRIILTTHSPYIINNINNEKIRVINRLGNSVTIVKPNNNISAESILGIEPSVSGTIFVEDRVALDFLTVVLEDRCPYILHSYAIEDVGGESAITERLKFPKSEKIKYHFVGIYDGDMKTRLDTDGLKWDYCFLPGTVAIEEIFREYLHKPDNIDKVSAYLGQNKDIFCAFLSKYDGLECHDWFEEVRKALSIEGRILIKAIYQTIMADSECIDSFMEEFSKVFPTPSV